MQGDPADLPIFFLFFSFFSPRFRTRGREGLRRISSRGDCAIWRKKFCKKKKTQTEELRDFCDEMLIEERNSELMVLKKFLSSIDTDNLVRFLKNKIEQRCREEYDC